MPLFPLKSMSQRHTLENVGEDRRAADRVEQYRVGKEALYIAGFPGDRYLPFAALDQVQAKNTTISPGGCCGSQIPMICLRLSYDGEFYQNFMIEKWDNVEKILGRIQACRPDLTIERDTGKKI